MSLRLDWCDAKASQYAVAKWHYSKTLPLPPRVDVGVWEDSKFIGAVIFSPGANPNLASSFSLTRYQCVELTRVALAPGHCSPTSKIVSIAVRLLRKNSPGLKLLVSYADPVQGHVGSIYQAMGWLYIGTTSIKTEYRLDGARLEPRAYTGVNFGRPRMKLPARATAHKVPPKHKYVLPLCADTRASMLSIALPYPKRVSSVESDTPGPQPGEGGATPTETLREG